MKQPISGARPARAGGATFDGPVRRAINAALAMRGQSLRGWTRAFAERQGQDADACFSLARVTIARRLERGLPPLGVMGAALVEALRKDLGPLTVPRPRPMGGGKTMTTQRVSER